ncbi:hypothetical protein [Cryobacterium sp. TMT1-66-1]|uniref:hypothetical protein n=1 Tax=Cryobacterium sp. TMT1-66-1 TaxID=1259242 RepID=UPI00106A4085|nr:hypothetical protein [Cryobacterium sp. TMT1-66-1]TFD04117.1 hypothetical protein E3T29_15805 [Cryobacterium sp. TMT1-66-1]
MFYAAQSAVATTGIPTSLLSALIGALVVALAGLLGAFIQGRREHSKWVREQRYTAYTAFAAAVAHLRDAMEAEQPLPDAAVIHAAVQALYILGPRSMKDAAVRLTEAARVDTGYPDALNSYYVEANRVLNIGL